MSCIGSVAKASSTAHSLQIETERFKGNLTQRNGIMSKKNPADLCSRGLRATRLNEAHFGGEALISFQSTSPSGRRSKLQKVWK